jgi:hypothetical protein
MHILFAPDADGADGSASPPPTPAAPAPPAPAAPAQAAASDADDDDFDKDRALATIKKLREFEKQAKASLRELETLRAAQQAAEDATRTDAEKAQAQLKAAEAARSTAQQEAQALAAKLRAELVRNRVLTIAPQLRLDPALSAELVKPEQLEYDDDGEPTNLKAVLKALGEKHPALQQRAAATSPTNPASSRTETPPEGDAARRSRLYGGGASPFDPAVARKYGGGVVWPTDPTKEQ